MITKFPAFYVFASDTDVGKTIFSAGICKATTSHYLKTSYIKPIQTGYPTDCDASFVEKFSGSELLKVKTLATFAKPISPHRATQQTITERSEDQNLKLYSDVEIISHLQGEIESSDTQFMLIEGAGGIASPSIEGYLQCDIYRQLLLPVIFIAQFRLGGISTTISSIELAQSRGMEVVCILSFEGDDENHQFLQRYFDKKIPVISFSNLEKETSLKAWYKNEQEKFTKVFDLTLAFHRNKIERAQKCIQTAKEHVWWPFTQHKNVSTVRFVDSALNDEFCVYSENENQKNVNSKNIYDASASWWTQGIGHASVTLAKAASFAAGRYGHVMFPGNVHEPVAKLTEILLETVGQNWANRVFFSDNGSTANEIAIKMAFRKSFGKERNVLNPIILGLKDSYHGDTHATMDATNPNTFKSSDHWYNPRGFWLNYPKIFMKNEKYIVRIPSDIQKLRDVYFSHDDYTDIEINISNIDEIFLSERNNSELHDCYFSFIEREIQFCTENNLNIGACLLEGVVMGSGGMQFVDPLFQKILIQTCQQKKIPVILDEVFTGFWRLGKMSAAQMLGVKPDIACYGKLLTGGLIPMAVTLSTEAIFSEFLGDSLAQALLHGHSYTATPVGCEVSCRGIEEITRACNFNKNTNELNEIWNKEMIKKISSMHNIERVFCLGSLFALELKDNNSDYISLRSQKIIHVLQRNNIDARPLGNVVYLIAGYNSKVERVSFILNLIYEILLQE